MNRLVDHANGNTTAGTGYALAAALIGLPFAFPELEIKNRLTAEGKKAFARLANGCNMEYFAGFGTTTTADLTEPDVLTDPQWRRRFAESKLGTKAPRAPAYIYHGKADTIVPFDQGAGLYRDWCALGASTTFEAIPGLEHISGIWLGPPNGIRWLTDRLTGMQTPKGCREVGRGTAASRSPRPLRGKPHPTRVWPVRRAEARAVASALDSAGSNVEMVMRTAGPLPRR